MRLTMMRAKLHHAVVTQCDLHYEGSVSIDKDLLEACGILPHEQVYIWNVDNGERVMTYALEAPRGSRVIGVNGAAARKFCVGDQIIISAFAEMERAEAENFEPSVVLLGTDNEIISEPHLIAAE